MRLDKDQPFMLNFQVLLGLDHGLYQGSFIPLLCVVQSAYLEQEHQSLNLSSTHLTSIDSVTLSATQKGGEYLFLSLLCWKN